MDIRDICLATYLACEDFVCESIKGDAIKRGEKIFVFAKKQGKKIEDVCENFWQGKGEVEPKRFSQEMRNLKSRLNNIS